MIDAGAAQSLFHQRLILVDIAQQNSYAIEWRASLGEPANTARDLDALKAFARRREEQRGVGRRGWRRIGGKEPGPDAIERCRRWRFVESFGGCSENALKGSNIVVARCSRGKDAGRSLHQGCK